MKERKKMPGEEGREGGIGQLPCTTVTAHFEKKSRYTKIISGTGGVHVQQQLAITLG